MVTLRRPHPRPFVRVLPQSPASAPPGPDRQDGHLLVPIDQAAVAGVHLLLRRGATGPLALGGRVRAVRPAQPMGYSGIPQSAFESPPDAPLEAALMAWGEAAAHGGRGELVATLLGTVKGDGDLDRLAAQVGAIQAALAEIMPVRVLAVAALLRPLQGLALDRLGALRDLALPPVALNLFSGAGPLLERQVPGAIAEFLELLVDGPTALLGPYEPPERGYQRLLMVALDAVEVPLIDEERYLFTRLRKDRLGALTGRSRAARAVELFPGEAVQDAVRAVARAAEDDQRALRRAVATCRRRAERALAEHVSPALLSRQAPGQQGEIVVVGNDWLTEPEVGVRDRLLWQPLAEAYDTLATLPTVTRRQIDRLVGAFDGGIELAQEAVAAMVDRVEWQRAHLQEEHEGRVRGRAEPPLQVDATELREAFPQPRCAPPRTLLPWLALLATGSAYVAIGLGDPAQPGALLATVPPGPPLAIPVLAVGMVVAAILLWQAILLARFRWARHRAVRVPLRRAKQALWAWEGWFLAHELPARNLAQVRAAALEVERLRERLTVARDLLQRVASEQRAALLRPSFPRRLVREVAELDGLAGELWQHYGYDWFVQHLVGEAEAGDAEARGRALRAMLESMALEARGELDSDAPVVRLARQAVTEHLAQQRLGTLDSRVKQPAAEVEAMRQRAFPSGHSIVWRRFFVDPQSRLARAAAETDCVVRDRLDRARATLAVVSVRQM